MLYCTRNFRRYSSAAARASSLVAKIRASPKALTTHGWPSSSASHTRGSPGFEADEKISTTNPLMVARTLYGGLAAVHPREMVAGGMHSECAEAPSKAEMEAHVSLLDRRWRRKGLGGVRSSALYVERLQRVGCGDQGGFLVDSAAVMTTRRKRRRMLHQEMRPVGHIHAPMIPLK